MPVLAADGLLRLSEILTILEVSNRLPAGSVGQKAMVDLSARLSPARVGGDWERRRRAVPESVHEEPFPKLWNAIVGGVEDLPGDPISSLLELGNQLAERALVVIAIAETPDVLHERHRRSRLTHDSCELVE